MVTGFGLVVLLLAGFIFAPVVVTVLRWIYLGF